MSNDREKCQEWMRLRCPMCGGWGTIPTDLSRGGCGPECDDDGVFDSVCELCGLEFCRATSGSDHVCEECRESLEDTEETYDY